MSALFILDSKGKVSFVPFVCIFYLLYELNTAKNFSGIDIKKLPRRCRNECDRTVHAAAARARRRSKSNSDCAARRCRLHLHKTHQCLP